MEKPTELLAQNQGDGEAEMLVRPDTPMAQPTQAETETSVLCVKAVPLARRSVPWHSSIQTRSDESR